MYKRIATVVTLFFIFSIGSVYGQCINGVCTLPSQKVPSANMYNWNDHLSFRNISIPNPPVVEQIPLYPVEKKVGLQYLEWHQLVEKLYVIIGSDKSDSDKKKELEILSFKTLPGKTAESISYYNNAVSIFLTPEEYRLVVETNNHRQKNKLNPLRISFRLSDCARKHSGDMLRRGYFSHYSPERTTPWSRASANGTSCSGENIAMSGAESISGKEAFDLFKGSADHEENMRGFHRFIGVGIAGNRATQMFGF